MSENNKLTSWSSSDDNHADFPLLYPWERLGSMGSDNWWIDANIHPSSEILRPPSLVRHPSLNNVLTSKPPTYEQALSDEFGAASSPSKKVESQGQKTKDENETSEYETVKNQEQHEIDVQDDYIEDQFGLHRFLIIRDGNCMYRALAQALVHDQSKHSFLRKEVVQFMEKNKDDFKNIIEGSVDDFLTEAAKENAWGSYIEILAITQLLSINIIIVTGGCPGNPEVHVTCHHYNPHNDTITPKDTVWLSWLSNGHYDAIVDSVMENRQYDEWVSGVNHRIQNDAMFAEDLVLQQDTEGIWLGKHLPESDKNTDTKDRAASSNSSRPCGISTCLSRSTNQSSRDKEWNIKDDEKLARSLQEIENIAYSDCEYLDQFV